MKAFEDALCNLESFVLYLVCNDDIVGFFIGGGVEDEYNIYNVAIKPSQQRKGYGWYMLNAVVENHFKRYESYFLEVRKSNRGAIGLYYKFGFRFVYERRNYYSEPVEDALVMKYALSGA
jgi:ribosomal-protein-alanine N-acetyltransferase